ncbi:hypothetical protein ACTXT7_017297 [Hymenolepis weldensis]
MPNSQKNCRNLLAPTLPSHFLRPSSLSCSLKSSACFIQCTLTYTEFPESKRSCTSRESFTDISKSVLQQDSRNSVQHLAARRPIKRRISRDLPEAKRVSVGCKTLGTYCTNRLFNR